MQNKTSLIIIVGIVLLAIIGGAVYATKSGTKPHDHNDGTHSHSSAEMNSDNDKQAVDPADAVATNRVDIANFDFSPKIITVKVGTEVTWMNKDSVEHNVVSDDDKFEGPLLPKGQSWSHTFNEPGTFGYHCMPHPYMTGTVIVTE